MKELNKIYLQDCITFMQDLEAESVDLIIADPPYNLKKDFCLSFLIDTICRRLLRSPGKLLTVLAIDTELLRSTKY